jgi:hypothetical protein
MNHKYGRWIFIILSLSFILKFYADENFWRSINDFPALSTWSLPLFCIIIALIPFNWFLEGLKWRVFLSKDIKPTYAVMLKIIFAGVSCAILTPNRMGDFIGRGLVSPSEMREETVLATFMGNFCQFFILLLFGIPALANDIFKQCSEDLDLPLLLSDIFLLTSSVKIYPLAPSPPFVIL